MKDMKAHHKRSMAESHESQKRSHHGQHRGHGHMHHSDPIVGGESESEGRVMGYGDFANMPQHKVEMKAYPSPNSYGPTVLDDTMGHVDKAQKHAANQSHKYLSNQH